MLIEDIKKDIEMWSKDKLVDFIMEKTANDTDFHEYISEKLSVYYPDSYAVERIAEATAPGSRGSNIGDVQISTADFVPFMKNMHRVFLNSGNENSLCSPIAAFLILSVLAVASDDEIREEILNTLGIKDIDTLKDIAEAACLESSFTDDTYTQIARTSVWVKDGIKVSYPLLLEFARYFNTDSFYCEMGSDSADEELRSWLSEYTGGLLDEMTGEFSLPADSIIDIISTIYYKASWFRELDEDEDKLLFHGTKSDARVTSFSDYIRGDVFYGNGFSLVESELKAGKMLFILPDSKDISVEQVMNDDDLFRILEKGWYYEKKEDALITLRVPEFDESSSGNIKDKFKELGLSKIFDPNINSASNLNMSATPLYVDDVISAARIKVNHIGVEAAACIEMRLGFGCAMPMKPKEIEFILDRPFGYVLIGAGRVPIMSGIINQL